MPNAQLPGDGDVFRDNATIGLRMQDHRIAMIGRGKILGIDTNKPINKLQWHVIADTEGNTEPNIPHPDDQAAPVRST